MSKTCSIVDCNGNGRTIIFAHCIFFYTWCVKCKQKQYMNMITHFSVYAFTPCNYFQYLQIIASSNSRLVMHFTCRVCMNCFTVKSLLPRTSQRSQTVYSTALLQNASTQTKTPLNQWVSLARHINKNQTKNAKILHNNNKQCYTHRQSLHTQHNFN